LLDRFAALAAESKAGLSIPAENSGDTILGVIRMFDWFYELRGKPVPYYAKYSLALILWKPIRKFMNVVIIPNIPFNVIRILGYRLLGFEIGKRVFIGMKCYMG